MFILMSYYFPSSTRSFFFEVTNLTILTKLLIIKIKVGNKLCGKLLFAHLCTGCGRFSDFYGIGKRMETLEILQCFHEPKSNTLPSFESR